jgi:hypothetical protein
VGIQRAVDRAETTGTAGHAQNRRGRAFDLGRVLVGIGALALIVSLFLDWYSGGPGLTFSAWGSFELVDLLLAALALAALYVVVAGLALRDRAPLVPDLLLRVAGPLALVLVVLAIIDEPPVFAAIDAELEEGVWIALAGAVLMTVGAILGAVRISVVVAERERRRRPVDPAAET